MMAFDPTRATLVARGRNYGLNFGNVVANYKGTGNRNPGGGGGARRKLECWHCVGGNLKRNCPKHAKERRKEKRLKEKGRKWCIRYSNNKRAD